MTLGQHAKDIRVRSEKFAEVVSACRTLFKHSPSADAARQYMRNRLPDSVLDSHDIGFFPPDDRLDEITSLIGEDALKELRLMWGGKINNRSHIESYTRGYFNNNNVIFPFKDEYGNIVALAGRTLLGKDDQRRLRVPKYKNTVFGKSMHLFGLYDARDAIEQSGCAIVVEGQIDCINCHANGFLNTVALTCSELTLYQLYLLKKMTNTIYLLLDNDDSGRKATSKTIKRFSRFIDIRPLELPPLYEDVDEYLRKSDRYDIFNVCYQHLGGA